MINSRRRSRISPSGCDNIDHADNQVRLDTAVLFLVFNRPGPTERVFAAIRQARPQRLYVAADGARSDRDGEAEKVLRVREIVSRVDWPCDVMTLFRESNLGCKAAVSGAISWFFQHEEQGIILEDDCLPHPDFFTYCDALLDRYAEDERVWVVTGDNFQQGNQRGDGSYYFSIFNHVWGWATWRRAWARCDLAMSYWPRWQKSDAWRQLLPDKVMRVYWALIFDKMYRNEIDTWDYPWTAGVWFHGGLTATPNVNLVSNIGFGEDATHTTSDTSDTAALKTQPIGELTHPSSVAQDVEADRFVFQSVYGGQDMKFFRLLLTRLAGKLQSRAASFGRPKGG
ncbi:glycosyltransferase family 2 protein [Seongchinamella unica]|uniref:Glycosyltransferase family 2 protein n=1 Tax=Seongchinamella unica TaxID=2547392 RepID=A0A4R5LQC8_9GAMM|nr:glycosyltransferase family 2 protein [Seongchinamella unica]TDG12757.1 glycosyltransferase family 2 protein [Seongchinamella unica]